MKKSFLKSLEGKTISEAKKLCKEKGHKIELIDHGVAVTMIARRNTVVMWKTKNGKSISSAMAGDSIELEK